MKNYYAFLDVVLDVFYSIILYNAFVAFPGLKIESLLMAFAVFVMLNYWWVARSFSDLPKYYLMDYYFIVVIMFIFSQWSSHFEDMTRFLLIMTTYLIMDALYALTDYYLHTEKHHKKGLIRYFKLELLLAFIYGYFAIFIHEITPISLLIVMTPYMTYFVYSIKKGLLPLKFVDNGAQPY